uniref:MYND-type domain-containing protein n=1 Tax=Skeletonema marinoi TaxID=267567 RepID=A0A7S0XNF9_9STRA|mmetsp:Transcript_255/g.478  ORF Transcript_255/g.478 Transcript_255/m.478 type:complete len:164 (+) Transcript_255:486-977(+)
MEIAISILLSMGTQRILEGNYDSARNFALFARYLEQCTAVGLKQTQALVNWPKIEQVSNPLEMHMLVKFFRRRIPCKCLDKKYKEVKDTAKLGFCYNPECTITIPNGQVERSKTFYCSRCRNVTYCSRDCQKADSTIHKHECDKFVAEIAKFEAKKQQQQPQS